jgi:hypothetical protein
MSSPSIHGFFHNSSSPSSPHTLSHAQGSHPFFSSMLSSRPSQGSPVIMPKNLEEELEVNLRFNGRFLCAKALSIPVGAHVCATVSEKGLFAFRLSLSAGKEWVGALPRLRAESWPPGPRFALQDTRQCHHRGANPQKDSKAGTWGPDLVMRPVYIRELHQDELLPGDETCKISVLLINLNNNSGLFTSS